MSQIETTPRNRSRRYWLAGTALVLGVFLVGAGLAVFPLVSAAGGVWGDGEGFLGRHGGGQRHGFFGRHRGHGGGGHHGFDAKHLRRGVAWMLDDVDATDEQVDRIVVIAEAAHDDLRALHQSHGEQRDAFVEALGGERVDREALEVLRAQTMDMAKQASVRLTTALAELAEVLTPEQRRQLIEKHEQHHDHEGEGH